MDRNYTYSYSGADCKAYAYFPDYAFDEKGFAIQLKSLATISVSVYEAKAPVRRLGHRGVSGFTKGIRTIAGSMVFLVIEDHPFYELFNKTNFKNSYSLDDNEKVKRSITRINKNKLSTMLEPFNILLFFQTEVGERERKEKSVIFNSNRASMLLENVEIISEGIVTSVNDMVTEIQMQFIAKDFSAIEKEQERSWEYLTEKRKPIVKIENKEFTKEQKVGKATLQEVTTEAEKRKAERIQEIENSRISKEDMDIIINGKPKEMKDLLLEGLWNKK